MKKSTKLILSVSLILIFISGIFFVSKKFSTKSQQSSSKYMIAMAKKSNIELTVKTTGIVFAATQCEVVAENSGEIKNLKVNEGDAVKKGQTLFTVYSDQILQQLKSAELNLEKQKLQASKAKTEDEIKLQNLLIEEAENNLINIKKQYSRMTVKSPINGLVVSKNANNGDNVQTGKSVLTIVDTSSLKVKASVDELDISKIKVGQSVKIKFNAIEGRTYEGKVESISLIGNNQNNVTTYDVIISLNSSKDIKINMTANVEIQIENKKDVLVIPIEALIEKNDKKFVLLANDISSSQLPNQGGIAAVSSPVQGRPTEIKVGIKNDTYVEVLEGLQEGQKILINIPTSSSNNMLERRTQRFGFMPGGEGAMPPIGPRQNSSQNK